MFARSRWTSVFFLSFSTATGALFFASSCKENTVNVTNNGAQAGAAGSTGDAGAAGSAGAPGGPGCRVGEEGGPRIAVQVGVGRGFTCLRYSDGTVSCIGLGDAGQLGRGNTADATSFAPVVADAAGTALSGIVDLSVAEGTACAVDCAGVARCWGNGVTGQMGNGSVDLKNPRPSVVSDLDKVKKIAVSAAGSGVCALFGDDNEIACWGSNFGGFVGNGKDDLGVQCGNAGKNCVPKPTRVAGETKASTGVTGGGSFAYAWGPGNVACWGSNGSGFLGADPSKVPARYTAGEILGSNDYRAMAAGSAHVCGISAQLGVDCWGDNTFGQLGAPPGGAEFDPRELRVKGDFRAVAAAKGYTCAVGASGGEVLCWGLNELGQLGDGTVGGPDTCFGLKCRVAPKPVAGLAGVIDLDLGSDTACALTADGSLFCWGTNAGYQLGAPTTPSQPCFDGLDGCYPSPVLVSQ